MLTLNVTNRIIMKITVWLIPTRQRFDNCLLKKFNYKSLLSLSVASNDKIFDIQFAKTLLNLSRMILPTLSGTFFNKFSQCLTTEIDCL
jgi:hypothetical protein